MLRYNLHSCAKVPLAKEKIGESDNNPIIANTPLHPLGLPIPGALQPKQSEEFAIRPTEISEAFKPLLGDTITHVITPQDTLRISPHVSLDPDALDVVISNKDQCNANNIIKYTKMLDSFSAMSTSSNCDESGNKNFQTALYAIDPADGSHIYLEWSNEDHK